MKIDNNKIQIYVCAHKQFDTSVVPEDNHTIMYTKDCNNLLNNLEYAYAEGYMMRELYEHSEQLPDYVGIAQYRKYFSSPIDKLYDVLVNGDNGRAVDIILPYQQNQHLTIYKLYDYCANIKDLDLIIDIVCRHNPNYANVIKHVFNQHLFFPYNMCIMSRENFCKYCEWAFNILEEYNKIMKFTTYDDIYKYVDTHRSLYRNTRLWKESPKTEQDKLLNYYGSIKYSTRIQGQLLERMLNIYVYYNFRNSMYLSKIKEIGTAY